MRASAAGSNWVTSRMLFVEPSIGTTVRKGLLGSEGLSNAETVAVQFGRCRVSRRISAQRRIAQACPLVPDKEERLVLAVI